jgi:hypothetical protein
MTGTYTGRKFNNRSQLVATLGNGFHCALPSFAGKGDMLLEQVVRFVSGGGSGSEA